MTRVIITGDRDFYNPGIFNNIMTYYLADIPCDQLEIICCAKNCSQNQSQSHLGADTMAVKYADDWRIKCTTFNLVPNMIDYAIKADWCIVIIFRFGTRDDEYIGYVINYARKFDLELHIIEF